MSGVVPSSQLSGRELQGREPLGREPLGREPLGREPLGRELPGRELPGHELSGRELQGRELSGRELLGSTVPTGPARDGAVGAPGDAGGDAPVGADAPILRVMATTRAMRRLAPDPVPADLIRRVIEAATWAPSGGNQQPVAYLVVTDRKVLERLAPLWRRVIDDYRALMASAGIEPPPGHSTDLIRASIEYQADHFAETPALIVVCEDMRAYGARRGSIAAVRVLLRDVGIRRTLRLVRAYVRARRTEAGSIYPAVQNLLLAARAYGLGACLTSWHAFAEDEFKDVLGIPEHVRTWVIVPIGWPLGRFGPVSRRPVDDVIRWERW